jgi:cell wall assembly regulator SMI1
MAFDQKRLEAAWKRYVSLATQAYPAFGEELRPGASAEEIAAAEKAIGCDFPSDLRALLRLCNGTSEIQALPGWMLFSAERIVDEWRIWEDLYRTQFKPDGYDCEPEGPIRGDEWWRLRWIPFTGDGGGNHLCVDMAPPANGAIGQVITMWHDDGARVRIATSITECIEMMANDIEQGRLVWDDEWGSFQEPVED